MSPTRVLPLLALFGTLYFVQGVIEPTACLPAQPLQSQLRGWGVSIAVVGQFFATIAVGWSIKPLLGIVSDLIPLGGRRRWPYLVASTAGAMGLFLALAALWPSVAPPPAAGFSLFGWLVDQAPGGPNLARLGWLLMGAGVAIALTDVVVDGLAVEMGQRHALTGQIQAVQWGALSAAGLLAGSLGGWVAQAGWQRSMFAVCGLLAGVSLAAVLIGVREPRASTRASGRWRAIWEQLRDRRRMGTVLAVGGFLFLWNFNPFSSNVQQEFVTRVLHFSEQFYGHLISIQAAGQLLACLAYGWYCRRLSLGMLVHLSIVAGIASTLCYWLQVDMVSAAIVSLIFGIAYQTGTLVQLDLAARVSPSESAATMFALLMAISNMGINAGLRVGGDWYAGLVGYWGGDEVAAFRSLVAIGALCTAGCWLLVPVLKRCGLAWE